MNQHQQHEITSPIPLLNEQGHITEEGWARHPHWQYDRGSIAAPWYRIKEWDYYYVISPELKKAITFTFSDLGYAGLMAVCWVDLEKETFTQADSLAWFPKGSLTSPVEGSGQGPHEGLLQFADKTLSLSFETRGTSRRIRFLAPEIIFPDGSRGMEGELELTEDPGAESMNIATSWAEKRSRFYYNRKLNNLPAAGTVRVGRRSYRFRTEDAMGGLDWGRGAWTYRNRWFWSSLSGRVDGRPFGFNLGYGFSDRSRASENMLFLDGRAHKLGEVRFDFDQKSYYRPWKIRDSEGRLELDFTPMVDRNSSVNFGIIRSVQHQVFGSFSGFAKLDGGETLAVRDMIGFAEDVYNRW